MRIRVFLGCRSARFELRADAETRPDTLDRQPPQPFIHHWNSAAELFALVKPPAINSKNCFGELRLTVRKSAKFEIGCVHAERAAPRVNTLHARAQEK